MKLRVAKKILWGNGFNWRRHFFRLRPPYTDKNGYRIYPSWHDIEVVKKARKTILRHYKRGAKPEFMIEKFIKRMRFKYRCKINYENLGNKLFKIIVSGKFNKENYIIDEEIFCENFHKQYVDFNIVFE